MNGSPGSCLAQDIANTRSSIKEGRSSCRKIKTRHRKKGKEPMPASMEDGQGELDGAYLVLDSNESVDLVWLAGKIVVHMPDVLSKEHPHPEAVLEIVSAIRFLPFVLPNSSDRSAFFFIVQ
jgi:hypothetical protein